MTDYNEIRNKLHEHPQTAGGEQFAHDTIIAHLQGLKPTKVYARVGGYGVVAVWGTGTDAVAFRADTDALPIGHRCGHDGHTTILLRLAELVDGLFRSQKASDALSVILVWQPAEETGEGAQAILLSGILQQYRIKGIYGLHNMPGYPLGTVVLCPRTFAAASTGVIYHLDGRETHASTPELGVNPGLAVADIIRQFSAYNTHKHSDLQEFRQSTLICVHLGTPAFGTSAGHAEVMFTLRAFTNDAMQELLTEANAAVDAVAARYGLSVSRTLREPFHATENKACCVELVEKAAEGVPLKVRYQMEPNRWSEDFAEYLMLFPGAMFGMGSGEEQPELHHPRYVFPDALTEPAAQMFFAVYKAVASGM